MNLLKIITVLNWIVIAFLGYLVLAETLFPAKGGDAAGRGMGLAIYYLAIVSLVLLLVLSLLPYNWAKYAAFGMVAVPMLLIWVIGPAYSRLSRGLSYMIEDSKPIFDDKALDQLARAIRNGKPDKLKDLLKTPPPNLNQGGELMAYAIGESSSTAFRPEEKLECLRLLFQAGATLDGTDEDGIPAHMAAASNGNAPVLRLLLEHGADPNAMQVNFKRPILFEAISGYMQPEASVQALLDFGAQPNVTALLDDDEGPVTPLWQAAQMGRWGVCVALLQKGADPNFKSKTGKSFRDFFDEASEHFSPDGYSTQEDFDRLKKILK